MFVYLKCSLRSSTLEDLAISSSSASGGKSSPSAQKSAFSLSLMIPPECESSSRRRTPIRRCQPGSASASTLREERPRRPSRRSMAVAVESLGMRRHPEQVFVGQLGALAQIHVLHHCEAEQFAVNAHRALEAGLPGHSTELISRKSSRTQARPRRWWRDWPQGRSCRDWSRSTLPHCS